MTRSLLAFARESKDIKNISVHSTVYDRRQIKTSYDGRDRRSTNDELKKHRYTSFFLEYAIFCESINMLFEPFIISIRWVSTDLIMIFVEKNIINSVYQLIKWFFFSYDQVSDDLR